MRKCIVRVFFVACALIFCVNAFAATIAVSLVQNESAPPFALRMTRIVENHLMDEYFASGEIVSNMQIIEDGPLSKRERELNIMEAANGMADYLLSVYLQYDPNKKYVDSSGETYAILKTAEWQFIDVSSSKILGSGTLLLEENKMKQEGVRAFVRGIALPIFRESLKIKEEARR